MRPRNLRVRIEALAEGRCEYCHAPQHACGYHFHLEHIAPIHAQLCNDRLFSEEDLLEV